LFDALVPLCWVEPCRAWFWQSLSRFTEADQRPDWRDSLRKLFFVAENRREKTATYEQAEHSLPGRFVS
jgi:hypothetical protein